MFLNASKRFLSLLLALIMVFSMIPDIAVSVSATSFSSSQLGVENLTASDIDGKWSSPSAGSLSGSVTSTAYKAGSDGCGGIGSSAETPAATVTDSLTFTYSGLYEATLKFTLTIDKNENGKVEVDEKTAESKEYTFTVSKGDTVAITISASPKNTNDTKTYTTKATISGISLVVKQEMVETTFGVVANGKYTVDEKEITATTKISKASTESYLLEAEADEGYTFLGWWSESDEKFVADSANATLVVSKATTITPVFKETEGLATFGIHGDSQVFYNLTQASKYAKDNGKTQINLLNDGILYGTYTIDEGVTLLIPFDAAYTCYLTQPESAGQQATWSCYAYRTLTMAEGAKITVNGAISVSAKQSSGNNGKLWSGAPYGPYGHIVMREGSNITVNNGGNLYAWGYITRPGTVAGKNLAAGGTVDILRGGKVYECFQLSEFRGGNATVNLVGGLGAHTSWARDHVLPFSQYHVQNVEVKMNLYAGAKEYVQSNIYMSDMDQGSTVEFIGAGGMFNMESGAWVSKEYNPTTDRLMITINGTSADSVVKLQTISVSFKQSLITYNVNSSAFTLPLTNNISINVKSGKAELTSHIAVLPGVQVNIDKGATLVVSEYKNVYVYDGAEWNGKKYVQCGDSCYQGNRQACYYSPTRGVLSSYCPNRANLPDAYVNVNGYLCIGGNLYTTASGAQIISSKGTGIVEFMGGLGTETLTYQALQGQNGAAANQASTTAININQAWLQNSDGTYVETEKAADLGIKQPIFINQDGKWIAAMKVSYDGNGATGLIDNPNATDIKMDAEVIDVYERLEWDDNDYPSVLSSYAHTLADNNFSRTGYDFTGWNTKADGKGTACAAGATTEISKDTTFYAQWTPKTINVVLMNEDGTTQLATISGACDSALDLSSVTLPTKEGHALKWKDSAGNVLDALPATIPASDADVTYTVTWDPNDYVVTFHANDGTGTMADQTVEHNVEEQLDANTFSRAGYTFLGWSEDANATTATYTDKQNVSFTQGVQLYAVWKENTHTVTFVANGGNGTMAPQTIGEATETALTANAFSRAGYTFLGWSEDASAATATYPDKAALAVSKDTTLYAVWSAADVGYTVEVYTMDLNGAYGEPETEKKSGLTDAEVSVTPAEKEGFSVANTSVLSGTVAADGSTVLKVYYSRNQYTVTYKVDGENHKTETYYYGAPVTALAQPTKEGYTFSGWSEVPATMPAKDVTVNGSFTVNKYKLSFTINGEPYGDTVEVAYGSTIAAPEYTVPTGYSFSGWTVDATMPARNKTYDATLTINTHTVTWIVDGVETKETYNYGQTINKPEDPAKTGHTFAGWGADIPATMPDEDLTFTAKWTINNYTITWIVDGKAVQTKEYAYNVAVDAVHPADPIKTGYTFDGWNTVIPTNMPAENVTITAKWTVNSYKIHYFVDGSETYTDTYKYGAAITLRDALTKEHYTFSGWKDAEGNAADLPKAMPAEDITVYGSWAEITHRVTFNANGGEGTMESQTIGEVTVSALKTNAFTRSGYSFLGWNTDKAATKATYQNEAEITASEDITLYAIWKAGTVNYTVETYTMGLNGEYGEPTSKTESATTDSIVTLNPTAPEGFALDSDSSVLTGTASASGLTLKVYFSRNRYNVNYKVDGQAHKTETYYYGADVTKLAEPTKEGYTFSGWSEVPATMPAKDVTVNGSFTVNKYELSFTINGEPYGDTVEVAYGSTIDAPEYTVPTGYSFSGWTVDATMPAQNKTYDATLTANTYDAVFNAGDGAWADGDTTKTVPVVFGTAITAPANPTRTGYTFTGWDPVVGNMTAEGMTFTAQWKINSYILTFQDSNGNVISGPTDVKYGTTITYPGTEKTGYTFEGWNSAVKTMPANNLTIIGTWKINQYTITFDTDGGSPVEAITANYGAVVTEPADPTKTGYTFDGWDTEIPSNMPAENVTIKATWKINSYKVTWDVDGSKTEKTYEYGATVEKPADPTKTGYTFNGWTPTFEETMGAEDVIYTATWKINSYTLKWIVDNTLYKSEQVDYGTAITAPVPTKDQDGCTVYTFSGWSEVLATMPAKDVTVTGSFTESESHEWKTEISYNWKQVEGAWTCTATRICSRDASHTETATAATVSSSVTTPATCKTMGKTTYAATFTVSWATRQTQTVEDVAKNPSNHAGGTEIRDAAAATVNTPGYTGDTWCLGCETKIGTGTVIPQLQTKVETNDNYQDVEIPESLKQNPNFDTVEEIETELKTVITQKESTVENTVLYDATLMYSEDEGTTWEKASKEHFPADGKLEVILPVPEGTKIDTHDYYVVHMFTTDAFDNIIGDTEMPDVEEFADDDGNGFLKFYVTGLSPIMVGSVQETHTVTFNENGATSGQMDDQTIGEVTASALTANRFAKTGYTFMGWSENENATTATYRDKQPITVNKNTNLYAVWQVNQYTITFKKDAADTTAYHAIRADYEAAVKEPADPTKTGYTFEGWDKEIPSTMPAQDVVITATWKANKYNAVFNANGGAWVEGDNSVTEKKVSTVFDTAITAPAAPAKEGHTFTGWYPAVGNMTAEGMTFAAQWQANTYTVTWNVDGVEYATTQATYGQAIPKPVNDPTKTGYTFAGWADVPATMPAKEDLTIEATWTATDYEITYIGVEKIDHSNPGGYDVTDLPLTIGTVGKDNFVFEGWTCDELNITTPVKEPVIPVGTTGDLNIQAHFVKAYASLVSGDKTTYFVTLAEAVSAAKDDDTVKLLDHTAGSGMVINKDITIDFGGKTYTVKSAVGSAGTETNGFQILKGNDVTLCNGKITADPNAKNAQDKVVKMLIQNYANLTLDEMILDGNIKDTNGNSNINYCLSINSGTVAINNSTITAAPGKVAFDACKYASYEAPVVTADNCTVTGVVEVTGGTLTVTDGTYTSNDTDVFVVDTGLLTLDGDVKVDGGGKNKTTAVWAKNTGKVVINGGSYKVSADASAVQGYNDLIYAKENASIEINGGTFEGPSRTSDGQKFLLNLQDNSNAKITVKGGTFKGFDPQDAGTEPAGANDNFTADGFIAVKDNDGNYTVKAHTHKYTYTAEGTVITEICFEGCRHSATAKLVKDNTVSLVYTGSAIAPYNVEYSDAWKGGNLTVAYENNVKAGQATAKITIGDATLSDTFEIDNADLTNVSVAQKGTLVYTGEALTPEVTTTATSVNDQKVTFTYSKAQDDDFGAMPEFTTAGTYTVYYKASAANHNAANGSFTVVVEKGEPSYDVPMDLTAAVGQTLADITLPNGWTWENPNTKIETAGENTYKAVFTHSDTDNYHPVIVELTVDVFMPTVQFTINGVNYGDPVAFKYGDPVTAPAYETPVGHTFSGWTVPATMPAESIALDATLTVNKYKVNWDMFGMPWAIAYEYGEEVTAPFAPSKNGYDFAGWFSGETKVELPFKMGAEDMVLTAQFTPITYTIGYDLDGGVVTGNPETYTIESADITLENPTKEGYTFAGWTGTDLDEATMAVTIASGSHGNREYTATWTVNEYTATWIVDGVETKQTYDYGAVIQALADPKKEGYTFTGWNAEIPATMPAKDLTFTATWEINSYKVTWDMFGMPWAIAYEYGEEVTAPFAPSKTGYDFAGWFSGETKVELPFKMGAEDMVLTAQFTPITYTIGYDLDGGVVTGNPETYTIESADITLENPTKEGYTFAGWTGTDLDEATMAVTIASGSHGNREYTATWTINQYTVTFDTDGGTDIAPITQDYNTAVEAPANPEKTGYTFAGWDAEIPATMPAKDTTIKAQWTINQYTITFENTGDTDIAPITQDYNTAVEAPADPEKTGYTFAGWDAEIPGKMPAEDMTIKAKWTINNYTVSLDIDGDGNVDEAASFKAPYNTELKLTDGNKAKDKVNTYTFLGWSNTPDGEILENLPKVTEDVTYYAVFKANPITYTITLDAQGGTALEPLTGGYEAQVTLPEATGKTGYTFQGWATTADPNATVLENDYTITEDDTLYAVWKINTHTVTWIVDGEETKATYDYNAVIVQPENPTKEGYNFTGWDAEIPATMPDEDLTFTAQWQIKTFTIGWDTNEDGVADFTDTVEWNTVPDYDAAKHGEITKVSTVDTVFTFAGWTVEPVAATVDTVYTAKFNTAVREYTITWKIGENETTTTVAYGVMPVWNGEEPTKAEDNYNTYTFAGWDPKLTTVTGEATYTAQFTPNEKVYTLTIDFNGGAIGEENSLVIQGGYETAVTAPAAPKKTGYTFAGWSEEIPALLTQNKTIKAQWTINQYTITFENTGDAVIDPITQDYNSAVEAPAEPQKEGHTFTGWTPAVPGVMPAENLTVVGGWTVNQYTITFLNTGDSTVNPITQNYGTAVEDPADPVKAGYTFKGWSAEIPDSMPAENLELTAIWEANENTISIYLEKDDEKPYCTIIADTDADISLQLPAEPTKEGHTFGGWVDEEGNPVVLTNTMPTAGMALYAKWNVSEYTMTFDLTGGKIDDETVHTIVADFDTEITAPEDPEKEGYTFVKWVTKDAEGNESDYTVPETMPASNVTVYAKWKINKYTISFQDDEGNTLVSNKLDYGADVQVPVVTKKGYTFQKWNEEIPGTMPAHNVTITSSWTINQYTITFDSDGGSAVDPITQDYATTIQAPAAPTKTGYTFTGWEPALPETMPAENMTLKAQWSLNQYLITWLNADGTTLDTDQVDHGQMPAYTGETPTKAQTAEFTYTFTGWSPEVVEATEAVTYTATFSEARRIYTITYVYDNGEENGTVELANGETITAPAEPEKEGYIFQGWNPALPEVMPADNITATAQWSKIPYTITFNTDGGSTVADITTGWGESITAPAEPEKTGYTFAGWIDAEGNSVDVPETMPVGGLELTAQWNVNQYTITFDTDGGSPVDPITQNYGTAITAPAEPEKEGYSFQGWTPAIPERMPAGDMTIVAQWKYNYTGWLKDDVGTTYLIDGQKAYFDTWADIDESSYFFNDEGYVVTDLHKLASKDGTGEGLFLFDEDGKFMAEYTGLHTTASGDTYWIVNGEADLHAGLVRTVDSSKHVHYYYFCDGTNCNMEGCHQNGTAVKGGVHWLALTNDLLPSWDYTFDEEGVINHDPNTGKNGFRNEKDGSTSYYIDGILAYMGLMEHNGHLYYVRSSGKVIKNQFYWISRTNGILEERSYWFNKLGQLIIGGPKDGVYEENGSFYYYKQDVPTYAGLIKYTGKLYKEDGTAVEGIYVDDYIYVSSSGELKNDCKYWISKTNGHLKEGSYQFDEYGRYRPEDFVLKHGLVKENDGIYYYQNGKLVYAGLIYEGGYYYYINSSCKAVTNRTYWITKTNGLKEEKAYTFDANGRMIIEVEKPVEQKNGIYEENGEFFFYENNKKAYVGLVKYTGDVHYADGSVEENVYQDDYIYVNSSYKLITGRKYWITKTNGLMKETSYTFDAFGRVVLN